MNNATLRERLYNRPGSASLHQPEAVEISADVGAFDTVTIEVRVVNISFVVYNYELEVTRDGTLIEVVDGTLIEGAEETLTFTDSPGPGTHQYCADVTDSTAIPLI